MGDRLGKGMVPSVLRVTTSLPFNDRMKIDKLAIQSELEGRRPQSAGQGVAQSVEDKVRAVAAHALDLAPERLTQGARVNDTPGWDSFGHINLMLAIEKEFGLTLGYADVTETRTLGDIVALLRARGRGS